MLVTCLWLGSMILLPLLVKTVCALTAVPHGWVESRAAEPEEPVALGIALHQPRRDELEKVTLQISTPGHPRHGSFLEREQLRAYTEPSQRALSEVTTWLRRYGIDFSVDHDWIHISSDVATANELLNTTFAWYQHGSEQQDEPGRQHEPILRTLAFAIPEEIADHVRLIHPTTRFGRPGQEEPRTLLQSVTAGVAGRTVQGHAEGAASAAACQSTVTPEFLKDLYNVPRGGIPGAGGDLVAFSSFLEEHARREDLKQFVDAYAPAARGQSFSVTLVDGGRDKQHSQSRSSEANMDLQYILGISHPIPIVEYSTGGRGPHIPTADSPEGRNSNEPWLELLDFLLSQPDHVLPQTLSISYAEEEQSVPEDYAILVCDMFMHLGARGVSVLIASGDSGPGDSCLRSPDGDVSFTPSFPAGCPYVTSVGATTCSVPERAAHFSSGGFSIYHERPAYQEEAVGRYLEGIGDAYAGLFNPEGRGIPDVAAQGAGFAVVDEGRARQMGGTSASTPVFAGVVALLNAARRGHGRPPLGFLNPWLYSNPGMLTDITTGAGVGCAGTWLFGTQGANWSAAEGWDPVAGLGTPRFDAMLGSAMPEAAAREAGAA